MQPFEPSSTETVNINVSASSQSVSLGMRGGRDVMVTNEGTATVWIAFGPSGVTASTSTGIPILAGTVQTFTVPDIGAVAYAAAIAAGATGKIYFTPGSGF